VSVRIPHSQSPTQRAEAVANANLRTLERPVLRAVENRLRSENITLADPDLQAAYNQAWHGVYQAIAQGRQVENLTGLLIDITYKRSVDIYRQRHEAMHGEADLENHAVDVDLAERLDDQRKIDRLIERLKDRLNSNERNAVTLCVLHGYKRGEAAARLGIEETAFQKIMDSATKKIAVIVTGMQARGCGGEEWARALRAFALGVMSEEHPDHHRIAEHIDQCASCGRYVMGLRGLAAVLPPIGPPLAPVGALLAALHKLFAPGHGAATMGASTAQTTATVAGTTGVGSTAASGGGLAGVLGGGAVKAAVLVAGIAAAGTISVHVAVSHHSSSHAHLTASRGTSSAAPTGDETSALAMHLAGSDQPAGRTSTHREHETGWRRRRAAPVPQSSAAAAEFGFESPHPSGPHASAPHRPAPQPSVAQLPASAARTVSRRPAPRPSAPRPSREESSGEFGFEDAGHSK